MRRLMSAVSVLVSSALLASCALLPGGSPGLYSDDFQQADARMEEIADALNSQDAAALKDMFSPRALEQAVDVDERLEALVALFPNGGVTWKLWVVSAEGHQEDGKDAEVLKARYTLSANGVEYRLLFADFTVNEVDTRNAGLYSMGVMPLTDDPPPYGPEYLFAVWAGSVTVDGPDERFGMAYPGVYTPVYDSPEVTNFVMTTIVEEINEEDALGLEESFAQSPRTVLASELLDQIDTLFTLGQQGELTWQKLDDVPLIRRAPDGAGEAVLLLPTYPVSWGGKPYWLSFAVFTQNTIDPTQIGINAIGVAPRTESGDSPQELALFEWLESFQVDAGPAPGIFIAE